MHIMVTDFYLILEEVADRYGNNAKLSNTVLRVFWSWEQACIKEANHVNWYKWKSCVVEEL